MPGLLLTLPNKDPWLLWESQQALWATCIALRPQTSHVPSLSLSFSILWNGRMARIHDNRQKPWRRSWQPTQVFLPGESPWTEEPGWLWSIGLQSQTRLKWLSTHAAHSVASGLWLLSHWSSRVRSWDLVLREAENTDSVASQRKHVLTSLQEHSFSTRLCTLSSYRSYKCRFPGSDPNL